MTDLTGGGAERMMVNLATGIRGQGVPVDLVLADASGPFLADARRQDVNVVDLDRGGTLRSLTAFTRYLRRARPQVIVTTLHHTSIVAVLAHLASGRRARLFIREATTPSSLSARRRGAKARVTAFMMRRAYRAVDGILAVSDGVADDLHEHRGVPRAKIVTLYNPVVTADMEARAAEEPDHPWFVPGAPPVVLGVGRLGPEKGFDTLVRAFARVRTARDARLVVLGEGPERGALTELADELDVSADVDLPGFVDNPYAYMARSAVYVLASHREGLPGALIQAMACGCPVVATDCRSGPAEVLEGGRHGALVPVGDERAMADAVLATLSDPARHVAAARERSLRYSSDRVVRDHLAYFASVLAS